MTYLQAVIKATRYARKSETTFYVVKDCGEYEIATDFDLDTFFAGISPDNILFCTDDEPR